MRVIVILSIPLLILLAGIFFLIHVLHAAGIGV